jgi:hypothetical protein
MHTKFWPESTYEEMGLFRRPRPRREDNIRMDLREIEGEGVS